MNNNKTLLLGSGYSLSKLALICDKNNILLTTRSSEKKQKFIKKGFNVELLDIKRFDDVKSFFDEFNKFELIIDSIPPVDNELGVKKNLVNTLKDYPLKRYFYLSTTGVYGKTDGLLTTEKTERTPISERGQRRLDTENLLLNSLNCSVTNFRLPGIYGPGRGTGIALKNKRYPYIENGSRWSNRVHVDDIVGVLKKSISITEELPTFLNLCDSHPTLTKDVVKFYCEKFNLELPKSISYKEAEEKGYQSLLANHKVSNELLLKTLNYQFKYPSYIEGAGTEYE